MGFAIFNNPPDGEYEGVFKVVFGRANPAGGFDFDETATAFKISDTRLVTTNHSQVAWQEVRIYVPSVGGAVPAAIVAQDRSLDLMILDVGHGLPGRIWQRRPAQHAPQDITFMGFPRDAQGFVTRNGLVTNLGVALAGHFPQEPGLRADLMGFEFQGQVITGSSGGPISDREGYAIGIVKGYQLHQGAPNGNCFGINIDQIARLGVVI